MDATETVAIGRWEDLGESDLVAVNLEKFQELIVIVEGLEVHEHGPRGIAHIGDQDITIGTTVEVVEKP